MFGNNGIACLGVGVNRDKCNNNSLHVCGLFLCLPVHARNLYTQQITQIVM